MNIGIVGLGLIGGSIAKSIKRFSSHKVYGVDINEDVISKAELVGAIDDECRDLSICDIVIIALYPSATIDFIEKNYQNFKKGSIVVDTCGVKREVCQKIFPFAEEKGFKFVGGHPMAGTENSGFDYSKDTMFRYASMILVPSKYEEIETIEFLKNFFLEIGFSKIQICTDDEHDKMIALTSQLAHILSSAYVKSPSALKHNGFSAGSFKDMTRVAKLNEKMWSELFLDNKDNLLLEINALIDRLSHRLELSQLMP